MIDERPGPSVEARVVTYEAGVATPRYDRLATEEPLEIRLRAGGESRTIAITMRTPGNDFELAAGFLHNEGILTRYDTLLGISFCIDRDVDAEQRYNIVNVDLAARTLPDLRMLDRHFTTTSACGVCGKANLDALEERGLERIASDIALDAETIVALPDRLRAAQGVFAQTGGYTQPRCSTRRVRSRRCARTWGDTTRSISSSDPRSSQSGCRSIAACCS